MLINLQEMLKYAQENNCAVGSFNIYNIESAQAVIRAAQMEKSPVIISFGESYTSHTSLAVIAGVVKNLCQSHDLPVVLHLDHSKKAETIHEAIAVGFTSVMYDGSALSLEENIEKTKAIVEVAHAANVSVEGELGYMNDEDGTTEAGFCLEKGYTTTAAAKRYSHESGIDALAIAIGNAHGIYKGTPALDFERLQEIEKVVEIPLVLHGSSGIPAELLQKAIRLGIRKININTEVSTRAIQEARIFLAEHTDPNTRFETLAKAAENAMFETIRQYIRLFQ